MQYDLLQDDASHREPDANTAATFRLIEAWRSEAALEAHRGAEHTKSLEKGLEDMGDKVVASVEESRRFVCVI